MKKILLKKIDFQSGKDEKVWTLDYKEQFMSVLNNPLVKDGRPVGISVADMETRLRIRKLIQESAGEVLLESVDYYFLKDLVGQQEWMAVDNAIIEFVNDVRNAEEVPVEEKKKK